VHPWSFTHSLALADSLKYKLSKLHEVNMHMLLDAGSLVRVVEETDQIADVAEAEVVPSLAPLTSTGTPEEGMIALTGLVTATLSDLHPAWLPHQCLLSSSSSSSSMRSMMNTMRQGAMKSLTFMPHRRMTHPMGCMALPWVQLLRVGGRMASMALTWARQHACLAAVSVSCMMLHICVADLEVSLAACVRHMSIVVIAIVLLFSDRAAWLARLAHMPFCCGKL